MTESFLKNCYVVPEQQGDVLFACEKDGDILARLDGYAVIPMKIWEHAVKESGLTIMTNPLGKSVSVCVKNCKGVKYT